MKLLNIILLFCIESSISKLEPLPATQTSFRYSISQCIITAAAREFANENVITISLSGKEYKNYTSPVVTDQVLLKALHAEMQWSILVKKSNELESPSKFFKKSDEYIIQIRDIDEFESILLSLTRIPSWNPYAKFIVTTTTIFLKPNLIAGIIFKTFWQQRVLNAILVLPSKSNPSLLNIFSWFPYKYGKCGDDFDKAVITNKCSFGIYQKAEILFPEKIPNDMNNCPIKIRAVIWPPYVIGTKNLLEMSRTDIPLEKGIEVMLMNTIAKAANFKPVYSVSATKEDWGNLYRNGTASGLMKTVLTGEANIGIGAIASLTLRHYYLETSVSYIWESVTWCIPHARQIPKWKSLKNIFQTFTWFFILTVYVTISSTVSFLSKHEEHESSSYKLPANCFQNMLSMFLGITVRILPKVSKIRLIVILWVVACLHLNVAFTSSLIQELTKPSFEEQIITVKEMKKHGFSFGLVPPTSKFFINEGKSYYSQLSSWVDCNDVKICLDRSAYQKDFAVGVPRMYMQFTSHKYITPKGQHLLFWTEDDIVTYPVEMIMTKGFTLLGRINTLISRVKEAGLITKWLYEFLDKEELTPLDIEDDDLNDEVILTKQHMEGAFILLGTGLIISLCAFIYELVINKRNPNL